MKSLTSRAFLPINTDLFNNPKYQELSCDAMVLYSLYSQRKEVSAFHSQTGNDTFTDSEGIFIYFSNDEASKILRMSVRKISTLRSQLIDCGLISVVRHGLKNFKIYVNTPETTPAETDLVLPWANFDFEKPIKSVPANSASTKSQKLPINQSNNNQTKLLLSRESNESVPQNQSNTPVTPKKSEKDGLNDLSLDSIITRLKDTFSLPVVSRLKVLANNSYTKLKWFSDTIFKAKSQVTKKLLSDARWLYNPASQEATRFESNDLLKRGLESALLQIAELVYKGKEKIQNKAKFIYVYLRNFMANAVKQYLIDNYELTEDDEIELNLLLSF